VNVVSIWGFTDSELLPWDVLNISGKDPECLRNKKIQKTVLIGYMSHEVYLWLCIVLLDGNRLIRIWLQCRGPLSLSAGGHAITSQVLLLQLLEIKTPS